MARFLLLYSSCSLYFIHFRYCWSCKIKLARVWVFFFFYMLFIAISSLSSSWYDNHYVGIVFCWVTITLSSIKILFFMLLFYSLHVLLIKLKDWILLLPFVPPFLHFYIAYFCFYYFSVLFLLIFFYSIFLFFCKLVYCKIRVNVGGKVNAFD